VTAVLFGLGIFCLLAVGSGFRHFGGSVPVDAGLTAYRCDPWWIQMGSTAGSSDGRAGPSRHCRQAAVSATLPAVGQSAAGGMAAALLGYCFVLVRRRHVDRAVRRVVISSS
jgi:hypothetical protein